MVSSLFPTFFISASLVCNAIAHLELTRTSAKHLVLRNDDRCSPGTYSKTQGTPPCYDCLAGTYSKEFGVLSCIAARAGYYVPTSRATTEMACQQGTYSASTGSTSCATCPPGYQCSSSALASPQRCAPGRYSTGGVTECVKCSAGTLNDIQGATSCCDCAAGWYNPRNTNCQPCSNQYPYSNPGTGNRNGCSATPGQWARASSCIQQSSGTCPSSAPFAITSSGDALSMLLFAGDQAKKLAPFMETAGEREPIIIKALVYMNASTYSAILNLAVDVSSRHSMVKVVQRRTVIAVQFPMSARFNVAKAAA